MHGQIAQGDHADQLLAAVEHGEAPNLVLLHQAGGVLQVLVLEPVNPVGGHALPHDRRPGITSPPPRPGGRAGARPAATARPVISRSVSMPTRRSPSQTGSGPISRGIIVGAPCRFPPPGGRTSPS